MLLLENEQDKVELTDELKKTVEMVCDYTLKFEDCNFAAQISVTFVDDSEIKRINKEFRNIDLATDVLSFPILAFDEDGNVVGEDYDYDGDNIMLGDIIISLERAKEQAEKYGHSLKREVAFLTAHSMLHLLGYDHMADDEEKIMFDKQDKILNELGIGRNEE